ncbi:FAD/NAD(P)-binding domain-containing protein [Rhizodiscina lignyota]|uniref:FAD/NAD(P)-binding domain-containing protein n=1 Tax=Rhizodiscina lignyota TaxID=1504668 RepID=A0A9P4IJB5_9PEZI|nr:FAD/NAD(P)-binding domain-containing protein [Rhizodiscina lignyota]
MLRRALPVGRRLHIGIVGGGVAGLRCAEVLSKHGVQVTIIEGRERLGGRVSELGHLVDLGPNWIHGTDNNPMMDLVKETGSIGYSWGEKSITVDSQKQPLPEEEMTEIQEFIWDSIKDGLHESNAKFSRDPKENEIPSSASLADFFNTRIEQRYGCDRNPDSAARMKIVEQSCRMFGAFVGQPVEKQSLKFFWLEECLDGDNLFCADSYAKVLKRLAAPALESAKIKFGRTVKKIRPPEDSTSFMTGEVQEDTEESFDEIVVTTPLGWLQRHGQAFDPPLPKRFSEAISALGYGNLDKVYITFPTAFWNSPVQNGTATAPIEPSKSDPNIRATTIPLHQPSSDASTTSAKLKAQDRNFPGFVTFLNPTYAQDTNPTLMNQEFFNMAALPDSCAQPTLLFYIYGDFANQVAQLVSTLPYRSLLGPAKPEYVSALWRLFSPYVSFLPNYDAASAACQPVDALATAWVNDELAGNGSYTNFPVGLERGDEDVETLREGLPDGGLWFAGEHTAPFVALGTVTGAYWAGEGVARRILRAYEVGEGMEMSQLNGIKSL